MAFVLQFTSMNTEHDVNLKSGAKHDKVAVYLIAYVSFDSVFSFDVTDTNTINDVYRAHNSTF